MATTQCTGCGADLPLGSQCWCTRYAEPAPTDEAVTLYAVEVTRMDGTRRAIKINGEWAWPRPQAAVYATWVANHQANVASATPVPMTFPTPTAE